MEFERVLRAAEKIAGRARRTPLLRSDWLSGLWGGEVLLKCENLQRTGSFKLRGALAAVGDGPVIAASAGNHGAGLAAAAHERGVPCTVVVPSGAPAVKLEAIRSAGATVVVSPFEGYDDTEAWAKERNGTLGHRWVSAYEDPDVIAGNGGTTALEILQDAGPLDVIVVPCGGAGLAIGAGVTVRTRSPGTRIVAVNTEASPGLARSWRDGRALTRIESAPTIAEGLEGGVSAVNYERSRRFVDAVVTVTEAGLRGAVRDVALRERMVIEGSAAAGVAALLEGAVPREFKRVAVVLTGSNIDPARFYGFLECDGRQSAAGSLP